MAKPDSKNILKRLGRSPCASVLISAAQIVVFARESSALKWGIMPYLLDDYSFSWAKFVADPGANLPRLISYTFLHANASHLIGNLVFFLLFAAAVEKTVGSLLFVLAYFGWGAVAALTQGFFSPFGPGLIGASGAISGVAGAFFVLFPLKTHFTSKIPAFFLIGLWFLGQLNEAFGAIMPNPLSGQVTEIAYWAHVGGFAAGALSMLPAVLPVEKMRAR